MSISIDTSLDSYRNDQILIYLKKGLALEYADKPLFLSPGYRIPDIVISKACIETTTLSQPAN